MNDKVEFSEKARAKIDSLLEESLRSGDPIPLDAAEWQRIRNEVRQRRDYRSPTTELDSEEP